MIQGALDGFLLLHLKALSTGAGEVDALGGDPCPPEILLQYVLRDLDPHVSYCVAGVTLEVRMGACWPKIEPGFFPFNRDNINQPALTEKIHGIVDSGFGQGRNVMDQDRIDVVYGGVVTPFVDVLVDAFSLIAGLDPFFP